MMCIVTYRASIESTPHTSACAPPPSAFLLFQSVYQLVYFHTHLTPGVTITKSDCVIFECLKIDRDTCRGANLILTAVPFADVAVVIPHNLSNDLFFEHLIYFPRLRHQFRLICEERKDRCFDGRDRAVEFQIRAHLLRLAGVLCGGGTSEFVLRICGNKKSKNGAVNTKRWFDYVRHNTLSILILHRETLPRYLIVRREIEVGAIRETAELFSAKWKIKLKIYRTLRVVCTISIAHFKFMHRVSGNTDGLVERVHIGAPLFKCGLPFARPYKIFYFHLLKFAGTKYEITRCYLVTECFSDMCDTERQLRVQRINNILEIQKNTAGRLGTQVRNSRLFSRTDRRCEHRIEHCVTERIGKPRHLATRFPCTRIKYDRRVDPTHIIPILHEHPPPQLFDVVLELDAVRAVIPKTGKAAVNFTTRIYKSAAFAQRHYFFHRYLGH